VMVLFFEWIEQHLRITAFFGTSEKAVKSPIWIAVSVYGLIVILKRRLSNGTDGRWIRTDRTKSD